MSDPLYTAAQAAALLERSPITVRQLARTHHIGRKLGRDWVFTEADIARLRTLPGPGKPRKAATPPPS